MITYNFEKVRKRTIDSDCHEEDEKYVEGTCLSTDTKPTAGIVNGSKLMEIDTSKLYCFDEENTEWREW